jgi:predicted nucleotidyltransferase
MIDFAGVLRCLAEAGVEYVVVGGAAATAHGSARLTQDLDIVYRRTEDNLHRLAAALAPHRPYLRGAPPGLPFHWDARTLHRGLNFTLTTDFGDLDLLGEITGGGRYEDLLPEAVPIRLFGLSCQVLGLDSLIRVKRAAGRPKDLEAIAELEAIREERARVDA